MICPAGIAVKQSGAVVFDSSGARRAGARATMSVDQRRSFWNVVLLCPGHHTAVDADEGRFTIQVLYEWKTNREGAGRRPRNPVGA